MWYTSQSLAFESDKIYHSSLISDETEVMMDWEDSLMSASAAFVTKNGGDILEIGFGMGISAGYIQSHSINSHTIIENHPQIIQKAQAWASNKTNVNIVTGSWYSLFETRLRSTDGRVWNNNFGTYDGLFYDTYGDDDLVQFSSSLAHMVKEGGVATWWNSTTGSNNF